MEIENIINLFNERLFDELNLGHKAKDAIIGIHSNEVAEIMTLLKKYQELKKHLINNINIRSNAVSSSLEYQRGVADCIDIIEREMRNLQESK